MRASPAAFLLFAACLAATVLAACAEGPVVREERLSKDDYLAVVQETQAQLVEASEKMVGRAVLHGPSGTTEQEYLDEVDAAISTLADENPPKEWQVEHDQLLSGLRQWRDALAVLAEGRQNKDVAKFERGKQAAAVAERRITTETDRLVADLEKDAQQRRN